MSRLGHLVCTSTNKSSVLKPLGTPYGGKLIKKYSEHKGEGKGDMVSSTDSERAPSTAEVMEQITHEKEEKERDLDEKSHQGFVSQTSEKVMDATKEVVGGDADADPETVKEKYKEATPGETYHKPRNGGVSTTST